MLVVNDLLDVVGVLVVRGDGTWEVYETGDKFWVELIDVEVEIEPFPFWCEFEDIWASKFVNIKFLVFLFFRDVPLPPVR